MSADGGWGTTRALVLRSSPRQEKNVAAETVTQANIGVVGLAVMGSNLARNLASREGNTVADLQPLATRRPRPARRAPRGRVRPAQSTTRSSPRRCRSRAPRSSWCRPARAPTPSSTQLAERLRAGRHHRRRRQRALHRHHPPREGGARDRHQLRRRRHLRRRGGRAQRPVDHARRLGRVVGDARPDPEVDRRGRRGRAVRHARRHTTAPATSSR